jgi:MoaA/NifB/PqqE/SkfB family radical SAM enzyme
VKDITDLFEHDICMWDNTHIFASRPIRTPANPVKNRESVDVNRYYRLNDHLKIRREKFGCLVQNQDAYTIKCFDDEAYALLSRLAKPVSGEELLNLTQEVSFLEARIGDQTLMPFDSPPSAECEAEFYDYVFADGAPMSAPIAVEIELTRKCNRHCDYCAYDSSPNVDTSGELPTAEWLRILTEARDSGVVTIEFTGGDPLTRKDGLEILEHANNLGFLYTINSDLTNLPDSDIQRLSTFKNLVAVQTTIDGASKEVHDHYRGKGGFTQTIAGVKRLVSAGIPVGAGMIISKFNYQEVPAVADLCHELGVSYFFVGGLYVAGRGAKMYEEVPSNDELAVASQAFAEAVFSGKVTPAHPSFYRHESAFKSSPQTFNHLKDQPYMASSGVDTLRFEPTGKCYISIKLQNHSDFFYVGDSTSTPILDIWHKSEQLRNLRTAYEKHGAENFHGIDIRRLTTA